MREDPNTAFFRELTRFDQLMSELAALRAANFNEPDPVGWPHVGRLQWANQYLDRALTNAAMLHTGTI